jgi:hypothetical protein
MRVLSTVGVDAWEKLPGTPVRVRGGGFGGSSGSIEAIGHYLKDEWLNLEELAAEFKATREPVEEESNAPSVGSL